MVAVYQDDFDPKDTQVITLPLDPNSSAQVVPSESEDEEEICIVHPDKVVISSQKFEDIHSNTYTSNPYQQNTDVDGTDNEIKCPVVSSITDDPFSCSSVRQFGIKDKCSNKYNSIHYQQHSDESDSEIECPIVSSVTDNPFSSCSPLSQLDDSSDKYKLNSSITDPLEGFLSGRSEYTPVEKTNICLGE